MGNSTQKPVQSAKVTVKPTATPTEVKKFIQNHKQMYVFTANESQFNKRMVKSMQNDAYFVEKAREVWVKQVLGKEMDKDMIETCCIDAQNEYFKQIGPGSLVSPVMAMNAPSQFNKCVQALVDVGSHNTTDEVDDDRAHWNEHWRRIDQARTDFEDRMHEKE